MSSERQDLNSAATEQLIAQRVAEAIVAYESRIRMACDLMNRGALQEAEDINKKRKWENNQGNKGVPQPLKKPKLAKPYTVGPSNRRLMLGSYPGVVVVNYTTTGLAP